MDRSGRHPKGRGSASNPDCRYDTRGSVDVDDGWPGDCGEPPRLATTVAVDASRTVVTRNRSPDVPFEQSLNPYRGCAHGCIYCFARPSHAYLGLSPGLDFESRLFAKPEAARLLDGELGRSGYRCRPLALGTNTDPYQPVERRWQVTRQVLQVLARRRHPVSIVTKSSLVERDMDLLAPMAAQGLAQVSLSITTLDSALARRLEPRTTAPARRMQTIARLADAGIPVGVLVAPVIPVLTDAELEAILRACAGHRAGWAGYVLLRLPLEVKDLFREWLRNHEPLKADRVMARVRDARGGRDNDPRFGSRMRGEGPYAKMIAQRFALARVRTGLDDRPPALRTDLFEEPESRDAQLALW